MQQINVKNASTKDPHDFVYEKMKSGTGQIKEV
jgi:hypothetical protein